MFWDWTRFGISVGYSRFVGETRFLSKQHTGFIYQSCVNVRRENSYVLGISFLSNFPFSQERDVDPW